MDGILRFNRGNNVYNFMVFTVEEMRRIIAHRKAHGQDYKFLYDRGVLEAILGHPVTFWVPDGFTAYEEGMRMLMRVDEEEKEVPLSEVNLEFADQQPAPSDPGVSMLEPMVTAVMGCHGGEIIEYAWNGLQAPLEPARITLRIKTQEHGRDMLLVIDEVLYDGAPATKTIRSDSCPEWLWEPAFFYDEELDLDI
ncbi:hypothetical protein V6C53_09540 [Desulfocurvibacter africanus]|uniref:hypothetical protein n=1 Tax=Desulfocurvibacter africanus TaxID=873 RepID=UPI002FDB289B